MTTVALLIIQIIIMTTLFMLGSYYGYQERCREEVEEKHRIAEASKTAQKRVQLVKTQSMDVYNKAVAKRKKKAKI